MPCSPVTSSRRRTRRKRSKSPSNSPRIRPNKLVSKGLLRNPPPDHVAASVFFSACLGYEAGKFGESLGKFQEFAKAYPQSPLVPEAQLRIGFCQVQMKSFPEAIADIAADARQAAAARPIRCSSGSAKRRPESRWQSSIRRRPPSATTA